VSDVVYTVDEVRDGRLTVNPSFTLATKVDGVAFRVETTGRFDAVLARDLRYTEVARDGEQSVTYVWPDPVRDTSDVYLERRLTVSGTYTADLAITLFSFDDADVRGQLAVRVAGFQPPVKGGGMFSGPPPDQRAALCHAGDNLVRALADDMLSAPRNPDYVPAGNVDWVGVESRYFLLAAIPLNLSATQCRLEALATHPPKAVVQATLGRTKSWSVPGTSKTCRPDWLPEAKAPNSLLCRDALARVGVTDRDGRPAADATTEQIEATYLAANKAATSDADRLARDEAYQSLLGRRSVTQRYRLYLGPKNLDYLEATGSSLAESVDFWVLGFIARPMVFLLNTFYSLIPNWGIAIALLTLVVKLLLLYFTHKSFVSMRAMQRLKPEMDALREKYGNDKQRLNQETMALYKRNKVNPLGGCLPMLLQMPVWIALYRAIYSSVELYQAPLFGWIHDLSAPDPYYVLPLILGVAMFVQQKLSPTSIDSAQARTMLYVMPVMFTLFMLFLPAGLVLYIFVNTILTLVQQWFINRKDPLPKPSKA